MASNTCESATLLRKLITLTLHCMWFKLSKKVNNKTFEHSSLYQQSIGPLTERKQQQQNMSGR